MAEDTETKEKKIKKKGRGKKALKVLLGIVLVIALAVGVCTIISAVGNKKNMELAKSFEPVGFDAQLVPEQDENGDWCFTTDKEFKVVQLTDVHIGGGFMSLSKDASALQAVASMLQKEAPDFVVVTGDIAYPVPFQAGTFNNLTGAKMFANLMEDLGVYWTLCFGNHDTELYSFYDREEISDFYLSEEFAHCLFEKGPDDIDGFGNQVVKVRNSDGVITQALILLDSHSYTDGDYFGIQWKYDNIHENQVAWYKAQIEAMNAANAAVIGKLPADKAAAAKELATVKSSLFFHIPLVEFKEAWDEFAANGYKDTENVKYVEGLIGETGKAIFCGIGEDDLFETVQELGSTKLIACGHDHFNNVTINYKGVDFSYGNSIDYLAYIGVYKKGSQRGCSCLTYQPDGSYKLDKYNLYESGRYTYPDGFADNVAMQFESITFQNLEE